MPLKHHHETVVIFVLAVAITVSCLLFAILPSLSVSPLPFAFFFALSIMYPLSLQSFFRENRADYSLRLLHGIPAIILLSFALFDRLALRFSFFASFLLFLQETVALPLFAISILFLAWFCLHVLRRFALRLSILSVLSILFTMVVFFPTSASFLRMTRTHLSSPNIVDVVSAIPRSLERYAVSLLASPSSPPSRVSSSASASLSSSRPSTLSHSGPTEDIFFLLMLFFTVTSSIRVSRRFSL